MACIDPSFVIVIFIMSSSFEPGLRVAAVPSVAHGLCLAQRLEHVADSLANVARDGVRLAVFPELTLQGDMHVAELRRSELEALAEPIDGPSVSLVAAAVEKTGVAAGVGWIERAGDGRLFNSYVVCMPDGARHRHRKLHALEHRHLSSGDGVTVFDTPWGMRMSILIGVDNCVVENVRVAAVMGASLLIAPHRCYRHRETRRRERGGMARDWLAKAMPVRAGENGLFVAFSEMREVEDNERQGGAAMIVDPNGSVMAGTDGTQGGFAAAALDRACVDESVGRRWVAQRRPDLYGPLTDAGRADSLAFPPGNAVARGAIALSFAVVGRKRADR